MDYFSFETKILGCMTTMPIDNNFLTQWSLQFIGIISCFKVSILYNCDPSYENGRVGCHIVKFTIVLFEKKILCVIED